jgi:hypothetical protein
MHKQDSTFEWATMLSLVSQTQARLSLISREECGDDLVDSTRLRIERSQKVLQRCDELIRTLTQVWVGPVR